MSGKAKTALKGNARGLTPQDHGFKHEPNDVRLVLRFVRNTKGNLAPKRRFERGPA